MSGIADKIRAVETHVGDWVRVGNILYMNETGKYATYSSKTNRLGLDGIHIYLDEKGGALIAGNKIRFREVDKDIWRLTKRRAKKRTTETTNNEHTRRNK